MPRSSPLIIPALVATVLIAGCQTGQNEFMTARMTLSNYAVRTPSATHMAEALKAYRRGEYRRAFSRYKLAANWANKHAQAWLGWMYLLGRGVERDPVRAWAWMKLAAERGYPEFVEEAENFAINLDRTDRLHADLVYHHELLPKYGDEVAIPRTAREMWRDRMKVSGSRVGYTGRVEEIETEDGTYHGGSIFYAKDRWDFHKVVAFETYAHNVISRGRVTLGDFELVGDEVEEIREEAEGRAEDG